MDIEIRKVAINMVKRTEIKDRMLELESFKYCVENGISTKIHTNAALNESYTKRVPAEALARFSKKYEKRKFDMSKVWYRAWLINGRAFHGNLQWSCLNK